MVKILLSALLFLSTLTPLPQTVVLVKHRGVTATGGWTFLQGATTPGAVSLFPTCSGVVTSCAITPYSTTSGSVRVILMATDANAHITSVTGESGWTLCPSSACNTYSASLANSIDFAYNLGGSTGTNTLTVNISSSSGSYLEIEYMEMLPPTCGAGLCSVSYDGGAALSPGPTCSTSCTGAAPTVSATDLVLHWSNNQNTASVFNAWSAPYLYSNTGWGVGLNVTSSVAPTYNQGTSGFWQDAGIAFKSSGGTFTPTPSTLYSIVQAPNSAPISCTPACDQITLPSTGSGNLLFLQIYGGSGASSYISSISWTGTNGGTWVIPTGCRQYAAGVAGSISCAYVLSSGSGGTKINITMTSNSLPLWAYVEVSRSSGSFVLDAVASTSNTSSTSTAPGQALTLSGTNADPDVIFQGLTETGTYAPISQTLYYLPAYAGGGTGYSTIGASAMLINTLNGSAPTWFTPQSGPSLVMGIAFK